MRGVQVHPTQVCPFDRDSRQHAHSGDDLAPVVMTADDAVQATTAGGQVLTGNAGSNAPQNDPVQEAAEIVGLPCTAI